jgi:GTPase SAR1 family protein
MHNGYLQGAASALIVCDLTRADTLLAVPRHIEMLHQKQRDIPIYILGNKSDLVRQREITDAALEQTAREFQAQFWLTSAKSGANVELVFQTLAKKLAPPTNKDG